MSEPWEDEGFGAENDWGEESLEGELEGDLLEADMSDERDPLDDDDFDDDE